MATVNMSPGELDIFGVRAGDRNELHLTLTEGGAALDLTGKTVEAQARKVAADPDPPALVAVVDVLDPEAGTLSLRWDGDDVRALLGSDAAWSGVWDLQLTEGAEDPRTILAGSLQAEMDVTR